MLINLRNGMMDVLTRRIYRNAGTGNFASGRTRTNERIHHDTRTAENQIERGFQDAKAPDEITKARFGLP